MEKYHWFKTEWHVKFDKFMQVSGLCGRSLER